MGERGFNLILSESPLSAISKRDNLRDLWLRHGRSAGYHRGGLPALSIHSPRKRSFLDFFRVEEWPGRIGEWGRWWWADPSTARGRGLERGFERWSSGSNRWMIGAGKFALAMRVATCGELAGMKYAPGA